MDVTKILADLREERRNIDEAIAVLERLARGGVRRRGRPPAWMSEVVAASEEAAPRKRGRPPGSKNKAKGE